jgi:3-oxoacyl-[acyl-carrier protein] reductase
MGEAIAKQFASEGAAVVISDLLEKESSRVVDEITSQGGLACAVNVNVTKRPEVQRLVDETLSRFKAIHILVNNAGITRYDRDDGSELGCGDGG